MYGAILSEREQRFVALADELAQRSAARVAEHDPNSSFPHAIYEDLHTSGYLRLVIPPAYGGEGASLYEMVLAQEHLARGDGASALAVSMAVKILGHAAESNTWPTALFATVCRVIATHGGLINALVSEPELGSISRGGTPRTTLKPIPGGWRLDGHKIFATGGPALRFMVVDAVLLPNETATKGVMASVIVHNDSTGVTFESTWRDSLSMRTLGNDDVWFEGVFVPKPWLLARQRKRAAASPPTPNGWALTVAAVYLGIGQAACDAACDYANNRRPSSLSGTIADLPNIQQLIGRMQVELDAARALLHTTARAWMERAELRPQLGAQIAAAKYLCTNSACAATETALRVGGGFSLSRALPLERYFRDARAGLFNPPQDDLALGQVGRAALAERAALADHKSQL